jgi:hypothetical protein
MKKESIKIIEHNKTHNKIGKEEQPFGIFMTLVKKPCKKQKITNQK